MTEAFNQTKVWRNKQSWYKNGKSNECENYQVESIEKIINKKLQKTYDRINPSLEIIPNKTPFKSNDGFEWTENFDRYLIHNNCKYYFNFKFVCDKGGAQTRTLKDVYHFIEKQFLYLNKHNTNNVYFFNILDGDSSHNCMDNFKYLSDKTEYANFKKYIYIGSSYNFEKLVVNFF